MYGYKWGLLKVREREIQREHDRAQVESTGPERVFLNLTLTHGEGRPRRFPRNNE
jgi:hypothetical protein